VPHAPVVALLCLLAITALGQPDKPTKTVQILGKVVDVIDKPLARAIVTLSVPGSDKPASTVDTDDNGNFIFSSVQPQAYLLRFEERGFKPVTMPLDEAAMDGDMINVGNVVLSLGEITEGPMALPAGKSRQERANRPTDKPIKTTLCEIVNDPTAFTGQFVTFRAEYVSKFQWTGLKDQTCSANIPVGAYHVLDDLKPSDGEYAFTTTSDDMTHPELLKWTAIEQLRRFRLLQNQNYRQLRRYADAKFRWKDGGLCLDCPLYHLDYAHNQRSERWSRSADAAGG